MSVIRIHPITDTPPTSTANHPEIMILLLFTSFFSFRHHFCIFTSSHPPWSTRLFGHESLLSLIEWLIHWFPSVCFTVSQPANESGTLWQQFTNELARGLQASYRPLCQAPEREWNVSGFSSHHIQNADLWFPGLFQASLFVFLLRFRTPNIRRSILESTPRTPTPFRSPLGLQEAKYGPLKLLVRDLKQSQSFSR